MRQPPEFVSEGASSNVFEFRKSIYGLKQLLRVSFTKVNVIVLEFDFCRYSSYYSMFIKTTCRGFIILIVYVMILLFQVVMMMEYKGLRHNYNPMLHKKYGIFTVFPSC